MKYETGLFLVGIISVVGGIIAEAAVHDEATYLHNLNPSIDGYTQLHGTGFDVMEYAGFGAVGLGAILMIMDWQQPQRPEDY